MNLSPLVRSLLERRGVTDEQAMERFLAPSYERDTHDPFLLKDMDRAVARILLAIARNERIAVYADFDCDGIPGAALLNDVFKKLGYENVETYIPHRDEEGYGFHIPAIDTLKSRGVSLIITVDVGTTAVASVAHAKLLGIDVIVTDHHEIPAALPACIVVNPKREGYPFGGLSGTGVAFKLSCALIAEGKKRALFQFVAIQNGWEKWLLDLVAIATIADLMPLVDENRALVYWGLKVLRKTRRVGLHALASQARITLATITEDDIGFSIAPRINAASRMDNPELAFTLLTTDDAKKSQEIAAQLESLNAKRKAHVATIVKEAKKRIAARFGNEPLAVLGDPQWKPALLGLVATSLLSERRGVVCVWGRDAAGAIKGSCRSDGSVSVIELLSRASHAFSEWGGHAASGGFTVNPDAVHELGEIMRAAFEKLPQTTCATREADAPISLRETDWALYTEIAKLAPFGVGNPKPLFSFAAQVIAVRTFGKEKNHIELLLTHEDGGRTHRAFDFFRVPQDFTHEPMPAASLTVLATIERDTFRGPTSIALRIVDVRTI